MYMPREVEDYKNEILANPPKRRAEIIDHWWDRIVPANLYSFGEKGAYIYITKYGGRFGEKTLVQYALQAETEKQFDMACGFWKRAYLKYSSANKTTDIGKLEESTESKSSEIVVSFQELWFTLIREQSKYSCYSIFWVLPSDKEAIRYLTDFNDDLKTISSPNTLVIKLGSDQHLHVDVGEKRMAVETKGNTARIARLSGVDFTKFPCLIFFKRMSSTEGITVSVKGMTAEKISEIMKIVFSMIQDATLEGRSPLEALKQHQNDERLRYAGKAVVDILQNIVKFSYQTILETLTKQYAPKPGGQ